MLTPSIFDTLAIDPKMKKAIIDDLNLFLRRNEFYKKVGKAWKRGYLLYGPPGTGKSSLIAAIANYLKFDISDLQLMNVGGDSCLKQVLLKTSVRSILVIEGIDCSIQLSGRKGTAKAKFMKGISGPDPMVRPRIRLGRMDVHIHMSYLTVDGFETLAANYLNIHDHHYRFREIKDLIKCKKVTPVEVAEELMKSDDVDVVLEGLVRFLKRKKMENETEDDEVHEAKKAKIIS
ncbi:hypothetical protein L1987_71433 [Smallanthus sonchifolius]|uniref:Uncharacterized protein n=1 Tax=Smallanthus sonchifolius TaxID=185202 RepID=A0ACB9ASF1_9ASTR|nr:hypothetical protein L1987_71433 [Smallanthus sonchifolius]